MKNEKWVIHENSHFLDRRRLKLQSVQKTTFYIARMKKMDGKESVLKERKKTKVHSSWLQYCNSSLQHAESGHL